MGMGILMDKIIQKLLDDLRQLVTEGLATDGVHHKQRYLLEISIKLGINDRRIEDYYKQLKKLS